MIWSKVIMININAISKMYLFTRHNTYILKTGRKLFCPPSSIQIIIKIQFHQKYLQFEFHITTLFIDDVLYIQR